MESHRSPNTRDPRMTTPRHIVIKMEKIKDRDRLLKASRDRNKITYKGKPISLTSYFSSETLQARRECHNILNTMKQKGFQPRILYPQDYHLNLKGGLNNFQISKS